MDTIANPATIVATIFSLIFTLKILVNIYPKIDNHHPYTLDIARKYLDNINDTDAMVSNHRKFFMFYFFVGSNIVYISYKKSMLGVFVSQLKKGEYYSPLRNLCILFFLGRKKFHEVDEVEEEKKIQILSRIIFSKKS